LFRDGLVGIVSPPGTPSEAIKLAADLTRLLGATPLFADPLEMDGLVAATHILPQLMAAGLLNSTVDQPGWLEGRKIAGRSYAEVTAPVMYPSEPSTLTTAAMLNKENVMRVLDGAVAAINAIRSDISNEDAKSLEERLNRAREGRKVSRSIPYIETNPSWKGIEASSAIKRFDAGPAKATHIIAADDLRDRAYGSTGTGFAHPKPAKISIKDPIGSR
ncbi:unnamed protein product, partial [marine sediment metagenome]